MSLGADGCQNTLCKLQVVRFRFSLMFMLDLQDPGLLNVKSCSSRSWITKC